MLPYNYIMHSVRGGGGFIMRQTSGTNYKYTTGAVTEIFTYRYLFNPSLQRVMVWFVLDF